MRRKGGVNERCPHRARLVDIRLETPTENSAPIEGTSVNNVTRIHHASLQNPPQPISRRRGRRFERRKR
jgi:hypothetical protein